MTKAVLTAVFGFAVVTTAYAHLGHDVLHAERYLKLDVEPTGVRVVVSLTLGPAETARIMTQADVDGDHAVSPAEVDSYMAAWAEGLLTDAPLTVDGEPVAVVWAEPYFDPIGPVVATSGAVEMVAHLPLSPGLHSVVLTDRMRVESFDHTVLAFAEQPGAQLVGCTLDEAETPCGDRFAFNEESAPASMGVMVRVEGLTAEWRFVLFGGGLLVIVVAAFAGWRLRRHSPAK